MKIIYHPDGTITVDGEDEIHLTKQSYWVNVVGDQSKVTITGFHFINVLELPTKDLFKYIKNFMKG